MTELQRVYEAARSNWGFACSLLANPQATCESSGINLNPTEIALLKKALSNVVEYYGQKLYLTAYCCQAENGEPQKFVQPQY